jgi:hypothetical protein
MMEAETGVVRFENMDENTFVTLLQFAYSGDYVPPPYERAGGTNTIKEVNTFEALVVGTPVSIQDSVKNCARVKNDECSDEWSGWTSSSKKTKSPSPNLELSKKDVARREFITREYSYPTYNNDQYKPRPNKSPDENYTNVFIGHARLYAFAEKYGIEALRMLTLQKLQGTLMKFKLYKSRIRDIVELLRFSYSNENTPDRERGIDQLRELVTRYTVCEAEALMESEEYLTFLEEGGPFVRDMSLMLLKRLN